MNAVLALATRQAHLIGAILATLTTVAGFAVFYDQVMPVTISGSERALDPVVEPGGELTIVYSGSAPRQCPSDNTKISIVDSQGVVYQIALEKVTLEFISETEAGLMMIIPKQASIGTAKFQLSYDKICTVLGLWDSTHHIIRPAVAFTIENKL